MQIIKRNREEDETEIDVLGLLLLYWKKKWTIIACGVLGGGLALLAAVLLITPKYEASVTMYANNYSTSTDKSTSISAGDISASVQLVDTYAAIIMSDPVLDEVIEKAGLDLLNTDLAEQIDVSAVNDTEVFRITVTDPSPETAAEIANYIAEIGPQQIESIVEGCSVKVVNYAKVPYKISSPNYKIFLLLGGVLAALLCCMVIIIRELMDTSIKSESDLAMWDLPVLGVIPEVNSAAKMDSYNYGYGYGYGKKKTK